MVENNTQNNNSIRIDLMRESQLSDMAQIEKIRYIIDIVKSGCIVVLESGLTPDEQSLLIEKTMSEIDQENFTGVDIESYPENTSQDDRGLLGRVLNRDKEEPSDLTVIGPANRMETLHKDEKQISAILNL